MPKTLIVLILIGLGACAYAYVTRPAACAKIQTDAAGDLAALSHEVDVAWQNHPHDWNRVLPALRKFVVDAGRNVSQAVSTFTSETGARSTPPSWTAPASFPSKPDWTWTTMKGDSYRKVKVVGMQQDAVTVIYDGGGRRVLVSELPPDLQKELGYDPTFSAVVNEQSPAKDAPEMGSPNPSAVTRGWITDDYSVGMRQARLQGKKVLLLFTGSSWCSACIQLERDIIPTSEFQNFGSTGYIMVKLELPRAAGADAALIGNEQLAGKYGVQGVPTLIAVDLNGKEMGRMVGCPPDARSVTAHFSSVP